MPELHSVVCVKVVPKPEEIRVDPETKLLVRGNTRSEINPPDMNAMEMACAARNRHMGIVRYFLIMGQMALAAIPHLLFPMIEVQCPGMTDRASDLGVWCRRILLLIDWRYRPAVHLLGQIAILTMAVETKRRNLLLALGICQVNRAVTDHAIFIFI